MAEDTRKGIRHSQRKQTIIAMSQCQQRQQALKAIQRTVDATRKSKHKKIGEKK